MEFILDFLIYPVIFLISSIAAFFTLNFITIIIFIIFNILLYVFYIKRFNKVIKIFFFTLILCIIITAIFVNFLKLPEMVFLSLLLSPFAIVSLCGILIGILLKRREESLKEVKK